MTNPTVDEDEFLRDIQAFVSEKWRRNPCDRCGNFSWAVLPGDATILRLKAETPPRHDRAFSMNDVVFVPIYCENCGNTVNIYSGVFEEWRRDRDQTT